MVPVETIGGASIWWAAGGLGLAQAAVAVVIAGLLAASLAGGGAGAVHPGPALPAAAPAINLLFTLAWGIGSLVQAAAARYRHPKAAAAALVSSSVRLPAPSPPPRRGCHSDEGVCPSVECVCVSDKCEREAEVRV